MREFPFEKAFPPDQPKHEENKKLVEIVFARLASRPKPKSAIRPEDFSDLYSPAVIRDDSKHVADLEEIFIDNLSSLSAENMYYQEIAKIFEALLLEQIEQGAWLGEDASATKPSKYDDYVNGVDTIVSFSNEEKQPVHLALALDITSQHELAKKFTRLMEEIKDGRLTEIKYFKSEDPEFRGNLKGVPRVIVGADHKTIIDLMEKWLGGESKELKAHFIQIILLEEITSQLEAFKEYAQAQKQEKAVTAFDRALRIVTEVRRKKHFGDNDTVHAMNDGVYQAIQENLQYFKTKKI